jgi:hypothetical protein
MSVLPYPLELQPACDTRRDAQELNQDAISLYLKAPQCFSITGFEGVTLGSSDFLGNISSSRAISHWPFSLTSARAPPVAAGHLEDVLGSGFIFGGAATLPRLMWAVGTKLARRNYDRIAGIKYFCASPFSFLLDMRRISSV